MKKEHYIYWFLFICLCLIALYVQSNTWQEDTVGRDVYYSWIEGTRLIEGENPYARVLQGNMRNNDKYATYFPLFYLLSAGTQLAGLTAYPNWIAFWRYIFSLSCLGSGALFFRYHLKQGRILFAFILSILWLFNNWVLQVFRLAHFDFLPIFFLTLSLYFLPKHPYRALISFSVSLALKQIAIFLLPIYLIWLWQSNPKHPVRSSFTGLLIILSLPTLFSIPFLWWEAEGYIRSILFSATRFSYNKIEAGTVLFGDGGIASRIPMLLVMGLVYWLSCRQSIPPYATTALTMFVFVALTPVLFPQYIIWVLALLPFAFHDLPKQDHLLQLKNLVPRMNRIL